MNPTLRLGLLHLVALALVVAGFLLSLFFAKLLLVSAVLMLGGLAALLWLSRSLMRRSRRSRNAVDRQA